MDEHSGSGTSSMYENQSSLSPPITSPFNELSLESDPTVPDDVSASAKLPLFNIERDGEPGISWNLYYDFVVTKSEAYYELQLGYLPTKHYPSRVEPEKVIVDGRRLHPCGMPDCRAGPFTRHYDLERHFATQHRDNKGQVYCDYLKCPHKEPFRKDHAREHYREYHREDLMKRTKINKLERGRKKSDIVEEFLAARLNTVNLSWWRCSKCVQRVKFDTDGYQCPRCMVACEPERVVWREKACTSADSTARDSPTGSGPVPLIYATACGKCENTWLPDKRDTTGTLWVSCPTCRPGATKTMRF